MKKTLLSLGVLSIGLILIAGLFIVYPKSAQAVTGIDVNVCVTASDNSPVSGASVKYKLGSINNFGTTDSTGCVTKNFSSGTTNLEVWASWNNTTSAHITQDISVNPNFNFQTSKVTLHLQKCDATGLAGGKARYWVGGTSYWFSGGLTDSNGETYAEFFPGSYKFEMNFQSTIDTKTQDISTPVVFTTTNVTLYYSGQISYGGPVGDSTWFIKPSMELLPGTYKFHFRPITGWGGETYDLNWSSCSFEKTIAVSTLTLVKTVNNNYGGTKQVSDFVLKIDDNPVTSGVANTVSVGAHTASEVNLFGYFASSWGTDCAENGTITLAAGENKVCTITNDDIQPILTIVKHVINDSGGDKLAGDFTMNVSGPTLLSFFGAEAPGITNNVNTGSYTVTESGPEGYALSYLGYCDEGGNLSLDIGESKDCTLTNDDKSPHLTIIVHVITDNGGSLLAPETTVNVTGSNVLPNSTFAGDEEGYTVSLDANTSYSADANDVAGYAKTLSSECSGTLNLDENRTCTITFNDIQPKLTVTKIIINDNGGTLEVADFPLFVGETPVTSGQENGFDAGTYIVSETQQTGYAAAISGDCDIQTGSINLQLGDVKSCAIANDDIAQTSGEEDNGGSNNNGGNSGGGNISAYSLLSADAQRVDANKDGIIDILDLNILMIHWGETGGGIGDFNGDGVVDILDFELLMIYWTI